VKNEKPCQLRDLNIKLKEQSLNGKNKKVTLHEKNGRKIAKFRGGCSTQVISDKTKYNRKRKS